MKNQKSMQTLSKSRECFVFTPKCQFTSRINEPSGRDPGPGMYTGKSIITNYSKVNCAGSGVSITYTGRKPLWRVDQKGTDVNINVNLGPGLYKNVKKADYITKPRVTGGIIHKKPEAIYPKTRDISPDPGAY